MVVRTTTINLLATEEIGDLKLKYLAATGTTGAMVTLTFSDGKSEPAVLFLNNPYTVSHGSSVLSALGITTKITYRITLLEVRMDATWRFIKVSVDDGIPVAQYGAIRFVTNPPGASVYIDGIQRPGKTPCTQSYIKVGTHDVKLLYNGMQFTTKVTVHDYNNNNNPVPVNHTFSNRPGSLSVVSSPGGAWISIDGVRQTGKTPSTFTNIPTGSRRVRVELAGMAAQEQVVTISSGKQTNVAFSFKTIGEIKCATTPAGASVYLDGILQAAKTPVAITGVKYGSHNVEFRLDGYESKTLTITVPGSGSVTASATLIKAAPVTGSFVCTTTPAGASVYIDGKLQSGVTPKTYTGIPVGQHTLEFRLQGYQNYSIPIAAISTNGTSTTVSASLVPLIKTTSLVLNAPGASTTVGLQVPLTGTLRDATGKAVSNVTIEFFKQNGTGVTAALLDKPLMHGNVALKATTNSVGLFTAAWTAADMNLTGTTSHKIYAKFSGNAAYKGDTSNVYDIAVNPKVAATTVLVLKASATAAVVETPVVLSGSLKTLEGKAVPNATIRFYDQTYPVAETALKKGAAALTATTNASGAFSVQWTASMMLPLVSSDPLELVAKYSGSADYKAAASNHLQLTVSAKEAVTPTLSLSISPATVAPGGTVTMSGYLMNPVQNKGIANAKVMIYDKDDILNLTNDVIATVTTNASGYYTYQWKAEHEIWMNSSRSTIELFARFDATPAYKKATSPVKALTIQNEGRSVLFDSSPVNANVDINGVPAKDMFGPKTTTPLTARQKDGTHTAKFYFMPANSPGPAYDQPISITFTVSSAGVTINGKQANGVQAMWESESVCTKLGIPLNQCTNSPLIFILDMVIPLRSITRILTGKDVNGTPAPAGKLDYACAALFFFPVGQVSATFGKLGLKVSKHGSVLVEAVTRNPGLADVLNDALFFNRVGAMSDTQISQFMALINKIKGKSATLAELDEIADFLAKIPAAEVSNDVINAMKTQLLKVFPDKKAAEVLELLKRTVPATEYGKEVSELFGQFIAGTAAPSADDIAKLINYAATDPDGMVALLKNLGNSQVQVVIKKLKLLGPYGEIGAGFLASCSSVTLVNPGYLSLINFYKKYSSINAFVKGNGELWAAALRDSAVKDYGQYLAKYIARLSETQLDALYNLDPTVAEGVAEDLIRLYRSDMVRNAGTATAAVIKQGLDKACAAVISKPELLKTAPAKIQSVLDNTLEMSGEIADKTDTSAITTAVNVMEEGMKVIKAADASVPYSALGTTFEAFTKASRFKYASARTAAEAITAIGRSALDEMVDLPTNKGQLIGKYSGFTPEAIMARVVGVIDNVPTSSTSAGSMVLEGIDDVLSSLHAAAETLRKGGIFVDQNSLKSLSTTTQQILTTADNMIGEIPPATNPITQPIRSALDDVLKELDTFSEAESAGAVNALDKILGVLEESEKIGLSIGTKLIAYTEFKYAYVIGKFSKELAKLTASGRTAQAVQGIADDLVDEMKDLVELMKAAEISFKNTDDLQSPILREIFKSADDVITNPPSIPDLPTVPDVPQAASEFVESAVNFFDRLAMGYSLKISKLTIMELLERTITDPKDMIEIVRKISASSVMDDLLRYGNEGRFLSTYIRTIKEIASHETALGPHFEEFTKATGRAAKKLLDDGGDYKQLDTMWTAIFDGFGRMKPFEEILGTKYYREMYLTINQMGVTHPQYWIHVLTDNMVTRFLQRLAPKSTMTKGMLVWGAYEVTTMLLYATGLGPGNQKYTAKDKIAAINADIRDLEDQCKWQRRDSYNKDVEALKEKIEDLENYSKEHKWALAWNSGAATPQRADAGIAATIDFALKGAWEDYEYFEDGSECKTAGGSGGNSGSASVDDIKFEISDRVSDLISLYFQAKPLCANGNGPALKEALDTYKTSRNNLLAYNLQYAALIGKGTTAGWLEGKMAVVNGYLKELEACLSSEGTVVTGPASLESLKWMLDDYRDELNDQYWFCNDLCNAGDNGLESALDDFTDMADGLQELAEKRAADVEKLGYTELIDKAIDRAAGRISLLSSCTGSEDSSSSTTTTRDLRTKVDTLIQNMETVSYRCWELRDKGLITDLNNLLPTYSSMISELEGIASASAAELAKMGYTDYVNQQLGMNRAAYILYSKDTSLPDESYTSSNTLADTIESDIRRLNGYYWDCTALQKAGDTTNFNTSMASYTEVLDHLKEIRSSKSAEVEAIGYTYEVKQAIDEHTSKINTLKSKPASSGSGASDDNTSGGYYTNATYDKAVTLMDKIDASSTQGWELCRGGKKAALQQTLKTYTTHLNSLKTLYNNHKAELAAVHADGRVAGDISYHTGDLQKLTNCASSGGATPEEPEEGNQPPEDNIIDEIDQYLSEMDDLWYEGLEAANSTAITV